MQAEFAHSLCEVSLPDLLCGYSSLHSSADWISSSPQSSSDGHGQELVPGKHPSTKRPMFPAIFAHCAAGAVLNSEETTYGHEQAQAEEAQKEGSKEAFSVACIFKLEMAMLRVALPNHLVQAFPHLSTAVSQPLTSSTAHSQLGGVLDILVNAYAPKDDVRSVARMWSYYANEVENPDTRSRLIGLVESDPEWHAAKLALARYHLHQNELNRIPELLKTVPSCKSRDSIEAFSVLLTSPTKAESLFQAAEDWVNLASLVECYEPNDQIKIDNLWSSALKAMPRSLAALNGASKFEQALGLGGELEESNYQEMDSFHEGSFRFAQTLTNLADLAVAGKVAVTAEGLYRNALSKLKPAWESSGKALYGRQYASTMASYATLLQDWEKRELEGEKLLGQAKEVEERISHKHWLPSCKFEMRGWIIDDDNDE